MWKKVLVDINADQILYVSSEHSVNGLLRMSDLNIMPWISTTFFEALYFNADIFVLEEDIFEKPFEEQLKNEIYYFKDNKKFLSELEKYLEIGNFYTCNNKNSKNYFVNFNAFGNRDKLLNKALLQFK